VKDDLRIAILGATSHIAKGLIYNFNQDKRIGKLYLFARSKDSCRIFLRILNVERPFI